MLSREYDPDFTLLRLWEKSDLYFKSIHPAGENVHPYLFDVLYTYDKFYDTLKFILDNWKLFYLKIDHVLSDIINAFAYNYYLTLEKEKLNFESKSMKLIIEFCSQHDFLGCLNTLESGSKLEYSDYQFMNYMIFLLDKNHEYRIKDIEFLCIPIRKHSNVADYFYDYNLDKLCSPWDAPAIMEECIYDKNADAYMFFYNLGFRCENADSIFFLGFNIDLIHTSPFSAYIEDAKLGELLFKNYPYNKKKCMLDKITVVINKIVKDLDVFVKTIRLRRLATDTYKLSTFYYIYCTISGKNEDRIIGDIIKNYSIDHFPKCDNPVKSWKINFSMLFNLHSNLQPSFLFPL